MSDWQIIDELTLWIKNKKPPTKKLKGTCKWRQHANMHCVIEIKPSYEFPKSFNCENTGFTSVVSKFLIFSLKISAKQLIDVR